MTSQKIAYMRVSSKGQSFASQEAELAPYGPFDRVFKERLSGLDQNRPQLKACIEYCRHGDALYVSSAHRLGRSTSHLATSMETLLKKGVAVVFTKQPELSVSSSHDKSNLSIITAIAEFETDLRRERQAEGIAKAQTDGVQFGRPSKLDDDTLEIIREMKNTGNYSMKEIGKRTGIKSLTTIYKGLRLLEAEGV